MSSNLQCTFRTTLKLCIFTILFYIATSPLGLPSWPPLLASPLGLPSWPPLLASPLGLPSWPPLLASPLGLPSWPSLLASPLDLPSWPLLLVCNSGSLSGSLPSCVANFTLQTSDIYYSLLFLPIIPFLFLDVSASGAADAMSHHHSLGLLLGRQQSVGSRICISSPVSKGL